MSIFEAEALLNQFFKSYKNTWEQVRILAFYNAAPFSKIKLNDVLKFTWDVPEVKEEIPPEELEKRKEQMLEFIQNNKTFKDFNPLLYS